MDEQVQRGLKLLSAKHRKLNPRAQVQTLRRIAVRALSDADWREGIPTKQNPHPPNREWCAAHTDEWEREHVAKQRQKAADAVAAMVWLNREHHLGYPVR